jgi:thioesterase domain-containing protein
VDGDHFTMFQEPGCSQMAAHIAADLALGEQIPAGSLSE